MVLISLLLYQTGIWLHLNILILNICVGYRIMWLQNQIFPLRIKKTI